MSTHKPTLYNVPGQKTDLVRVYWFAFGLWLLLSFVGLFAVTQYVAHEFGRAQILGDPSWGGFYAPHSVFIWMFQFFRPDAPAAVRDTLSMATAMLGAVGIGSLFVAMGFVWHLSLIHI